VTNTNVSIKKFTCDCKNAYKKDLCKKCKHIHYAAINEGHYHKPDAGWEEPAIYSSRKLKSACEKGGECQNNPLGRPLKRCGIPSQEAEKTRNAEDTQLALDSYNIGKEEANAVWRGRISKALNDAFVPLCNCSDYNPKCEICKAYEKLRRELLGGEK
jgi:hypothetical protein